MFVFTLTSRPQDAISRPGETLSMQILFIFTLTVLLQEAVVGIVYAINNPFKTLGMSILFILTLTSRPQEALVRLVFSSSESTDELDMLLVAGSSGGFGTVLFALV